MEEERDSHQRRDFASYTTPATLLHRITARSSPSVVTQCGRQRDQQRRDADGQCRTGGALDHHTARQRNDHRRADGNVFRDRHGHSTMSYQWNKNGTAISGATSSSYTTPRKRLRPAARSSRSRSPIGRKHYQQCRNSHGQCRHRGAFDHHAARQRRRSPPDRPPRSR